MHNLNCSSVTFADDFEVPVPASHPTHHRHHRRHHDPPPQNFQLSNLNHVPPNRSSRYPSWHTQPALQTRFLPCSARARLSIMLVPVLVRHGADSLVTVLTGIGHGQGSDEVTESSQDPLSGSLESYALALRRSSGWASDSRQARAPTASDSAGGHARAQGHNQGQGSSQGGGQRPLPLAVAAGPRLSPADGIKLKGGGRRGSETKLGG
eukprot:3238774-Rhodomonas_salina.1